MTRVPIMKIREMVNWNTMSPFRNHHFSLPFVAPVPLKVNAGNQEDRNRAGYNPRQQRSKSGYALPPEYPGIDSKRIEGHSGERQ